MSAPTNPPELPSPQPAPSGQWAYPTDEKGEPKKKYVLWIVFGAAGCFVGIIVLGIAVTVLVPNILRSLGSAQKERAQREIEILCAALEEYAVGHAGQYPESLEALLQPDSPGRTLLSDLGELPRDPWERAYHYEKPTAERSWPDVYTLGRDGLPGGKGPDEDLHPIRLPPRSR